MLIFLFDLNLLLIKCHITLLTLTWPIPIPNFRVFVLDSLIGWLFFSYCFFHLSLFYSVSITFKIKILVVDLLYFDSFSSFFVPQILISFFVDL